MVYLPQMLFAPREFVFQTFPISRAEQMVVEIEVDSLSQLADVLPSAPDIVLLDNMSCEELGRAVTLREVKPLT